MIYLNDLEKCLTYIITIASDDVVKLVDDAYQELSNFPEWMRVNKLRFNPKGNEIMGVGYVRKQI